MVSRDRQNLSAYAFYPNRCLGASFNNFLDAIDGSYCTFEGGDDPHADEIYPDPAPGGYKGSSRHL